MINIETAMLFVDIVSYGSLTKAAENLGRSKSQLSRKLSALEQQLNTQLLERLPQGLKLTEAGENYLNACLKIKNDFNHANQLVLSTHTTVKGRIVISAPLTLGSLVVGPMLNDLLTEHPQLQVALDLSDTPRDLDKDNIDIAIRAASQLGSVNLKARKLHSYHYKICASPEYLKLHGRPKRPEELKEHRAICCLTGSLNQPPKHWPLFVNGKEENVIINPVAEVTHMGIQKQMALDGQGIIRLPSYWVDEPIRAGELVSILSEYEQKTSHIFALYKPQRPIAKTVSTVLDKLKQTFASF